METFYMLEGVLANMLDGDLLHVGGSVLDGGPFTCWREC